MTVRRAASVFVALCFLAGLTGCAASQSQGEASKKPVSVAADFCTEFAKAGGDGATVGPIQIWLPKADLLSDVEGRLKVMGDLKPPSAIASGWNAAKAFYEKVDAAAKQMPDGSTISDVNSDLPLVQESVSAGDTAGKVGEYIAEHCPAS